MRPHLTGRNRAVERWRRAGLLRRSLIALEPFAKDLRQLWSLHTPVPSSAKALASAVIIFIIIVPLLYVPSVFAATAVALNPRSSQMAWYVTHFELSKAMHMKLGHAFSYVVAWSSTLFSSLDFVRVLHEAGGATELDVSYDGNDDFED